MQDTIGEHLLEVDKAAREREEIILKQLEEKDPLPDKEKNQMAWVRAANITITCWCDFEMPSWHFKL